MRFKRIFLTVLDSVGVGAAFDAEKYDDLGTNTALHAIEKSGVKLPNLKDLGLYNLIGLSNNEPKGYYTYAKPFNDDKNTLVGHYELMGVHIKERFKVYTDTGFPKDLLDELERRIGRKVIGNYAASGTEIIKELGEEHIKTGAIIVYTSQDPVLQIAAHEDVIPLEELYNICHIAREITKEPKWLVSRIIARPFTGEYPFTRTSNRHDYTLNPPTKTVLDNLKDNNLDSIGVGKISDIFNGCGITESIRIQDNLDGINKILEVEDKPFTGLCFINLNDYDSKYGHRRDPIGYGNALKEFDNYLPNILNKLNNDDLLIIVADHGNDPTYKGTDHTRENIPVLIYSPVLKEHGYIEPCSSFADVGATIADNFNVSNSDLGKSFLNKLM